MLLREVFNKARSNPGSATGTEDPSAAGVGESFGRTMKR
jgi:hypothetical protein